MKTIQLISAIGKDGILKVQLPDEMKDQQLEILIVIQATNHQSKADKNGWASGFFEKTYGAMAHDPIERPYQGEFEIREPL